jgi:DNA-binding XRE family transcriptional regulator
MEPNELKEKFILLRAQGYSFDRLAKELGKSKQTLVNWSKELEEEIANLKSMEIEALNERFYLSKQHKIQAFGEVLDKIKAEMSARDLSDVPTDKLMDLFLKYYALLEAERIEPRFRSSSEIREAKGDKAALDTLVGAAGAQAHGELKAV